MRALTIISDLLWLNVLALVCCIPVITTGASLTAMHYMALKIVRGEDGRITAGFFGAFKENFKQSTIIWLIMLIISVVLGVDLYIIYFKIMTFPAAVELLVTVITILVLLMFTFVFPVQAKFANPVPRTFKNALLVSVLQLPKTIVMIALNVSVVLLFIWVRTMPIALFFGISAPAYVDALLYNKFFKKLEDQILEANGGTEEGTGEDEDERIFHDELDESISVAENNH